MGVFTNSGWVRVAGGFVAAVTVVLNGGLVWQSLG
jgi:hypothetical protein